MTQRYFQLSRTHLAVAEIVVNIFRKSLLHTGQIWLKNVKPFFNKIISKTVYELLKHPIVMMLMAKPLILQAIFVEKKACDS